MDRQRADINARLALGEATEADLVEIDRQRKIHEEAKRASELVIRPARQAVKDLRLRLNAEQDKLKRLKNVHESRRLDSIAALMERDGAELVELGHAFHAKLGHVVALNMLFGDANPAGIDQRTPYVLPTLRLKAFVGVHGNHLHSMDELTGFGRGEVLRANVVERLREMGVE